MFSVWDAAHLLELAVSTDVIDNVPCMKSTLETLSKVVVFISYGE